MSSARGFVCKDCGKVVPAYLAEYGPLCERCWSDYGASLQEGGESRDDLHVHGEGQCEASCWDENGDLRVDLDIAGRLIEVLT